MNIFQTIFEDQYLQTIRSLRYRLLIKLAGDSASKFTSLDPIVSGLTIQKCEQKRKAEFVQVLIELLIAGAPVESLPDLSVCSDVSGSSCDVTNPNFAAIVNGISLNSLIPERVTAIENA
jgi:hypothetical protein